MSASEIVTRPSSGWVRWEDEDRRFLTICPEGKDGKDGKPQMYEVEESSTGWNLFKCQSNVCYRLRRDGADPLLLTCNCPDAVQRGKTTECKHCKGLRAALEKEARRQRVRTERRAK